MQENYRYTGKSVEVAGNDEWKTRGEQGEALHCYYNNDKTKSKKYGALYNWNVLKVNNFTPNKWRVPTKNDFNKLMSYGQHQVIIPSLFNVVLGGYRDSDGTFRRIDKTGIWWSSTLEDNYPIFFINDGETFGIPENNNGYSIRLIKNKDD